MVDIPRTAKDIETLVLNGDQAGLANEMNLLAQYDSDTIYQIDQRLAMDHSADLRLPNLHLDEISEGPAKREENPQGQIWYGRVIGLDGTMGGGEGYGDSVEALSDQRRTPPLRPMITSPAYATFAGPDFESKTAPPIPQTTKAPQR